MKGFWAGAIFWGVTGSAATEIQILDRTGEVSRRLVVETSLCEARGGDLHWVLESPGGTLTLEGPQYQELAHNPEFSWRFDAKSNLRVLFEDRLQFKWSLHSGGTPAGQCEWSVRRGKKREARVQCAHLRNSEMPGILAFRVPWTPLDCPVVAD